MKKVKADQVGHIISQKGVYEISVLSVILDGSFYSEAHYTVSFFCKNCIPSLFVNAVYSCLVFSLLTSGIIMSHFFLTLSLSFFTAVCCLLCCKLLPCTPVICHSFFVACGRSRRAGPVAKAPPKRLAPSKGCVSFVFNYTSPQMLKQTLTPNQLICEVSPVENKRSTMKTLPEHLQNVSLVFFTHTVFLQLLFNLLFCGRHASSPFTR